MSLEVEVFAALFLALLLTITTLLAITYYAFFRMNVQIRRARLFIMSDRIQRFLLAFFLGFLSLVVAFVPSFSDVPIPAAITTFGVFFFFGTATYGSPELYFVAMPKSRLRFQSRRSRTSDRALPGGLDEGK
jgi:zinc transporter ZupT